MDTVKGRVNAVVIAVMLEPCVAIVMHISILLIKTTHTSNALNVLMVVLVAVLQKDQKVAELVERDM